MSARGAGPAEGVLSSIRPVPLLTGLEPAVLIQQSVYCCKYKIYIIFLKPLDNKFPIWYNKTLSPLEPGEPYLLLIENRIPNNRYVPGAPAGRATWLTSRLKDVRAKDQTVGLLPADARCQTAGLMILLYAAAVSTGLEQAQVLPGVRRPWRQPATVRLLWLHIGSGRHGKTVGEDDYQVRPDGHGKSCVQHTHISFYKHS